MVHSCKIISPLAFLSSVFFKCNIVILELFCFLLASFHSFLNKYLFFKLFSKCLKEIMRCAPPSTHMCNFFKILILCVVRGGKGQKMAQNDKSFSLSHTVSQKPHIKWLWFLVHRFIMMISPAIFYGEKRKKWPRIANFNLSWYISEEDF